ncbi:glycosyltransferase family 39 protein [Patescibacteria group bacterium]|nr:glycosyltransferase family 39 protein [Patescibacteria group bacterium]
MIYLILLLAFVLRLPLLNGSFWLDEAAQFLESARPLSQQLNIVDDFQPPLMHLLTFFSIRLGNLFGLGQTEWFLRLIPSLIPGVLTIWALYHLALKLTNRKIALLSSLFVATSSFHIFYSQELRPYSLPALWAILATWQMLIMLRSKAKKPLILFIIFSILGLYSSYLYPFLLIGQFIYLLKEKLSFSKILASGGLIVAGFLPWLPKFLEQLQAGQALRLSMPGWSETVSLPIFKTALILPLKFVFGVSNLEMNLSYAFLALMVFAPLAYLLFLSLRQKQKHLNFFFCILFLPLLLSWLVSFFIPVLQAKRVLFLLPIFAMLEAFLIMTYYKQKPHLVRILVSAILIINLFSTLAYWTKPNLQGENWRALTQEITAKFPKNETAVVFSFNAPFAPWEFYDQTGFDTFSSGVYYTSDLENPAETFKGLSDYSYVLVFDYLRDLTDPEDVLLKTVRDLGFKEVGVIDYPNIGFVRIYTLDNIIIADAK